MSARTVAAFVAALVACAGCRMAASRRDPLQRQAIPAQNPPLPERPAVVARPLPPPAPAEVGVRPIEMSCVPRPTPPAPPAPAGSPPTEAVIVPASHTEPAQLPAPAPAAPEDAALIRQMFDESRRRWAAVPDFRAKLQKREVVGGRKQPEEVAEYRFRQNPKSVALRIVSSPGLGRELLYVHGRDGDSMHVVTGEGDSRLVGVGYKTTLRMDSAQATAKSRYRIREAGFGRTLAGLEQAFAWAEQGKAKLAWRPALDVPGLAGVEIAVPAGVDPTLPRGGCRRIGFDIRPESPAFALPVLVQAWDAAGAEVEFYHFTELQLPAGLTDADFDPKRMGM